MAKTASVSRSKSTHRTSKVEKVEVVKHVVSKETARYREHIPQIEKRDGRLVPFEFG